MGNTYWEGTVRRWLIILGEMIAKELDWLLFYMCLYAHGNI